MADLGDDTTAAALDDSPPASSPPRSLLVRALEKRRTWVAMFLLAYACLISSSWNLLLSIRSWYTTTASVTATATATVTDGPGVGGWGWPALYASVMYGGVFGVLSMAAALAVAVPATVVTWITVLVLLTFAGRPRRRLVAEGRKITADIAGIAFRIVLREGNAVAFACAVLSFLALFRRRAPEEDD